MKYRILIAWSVLASLTIGGIAPQPASASETNYPTRAIEVVVPFPPGGTSDLSVRFLADKWAEFLKQPVVIVNKPGAASALGAAFVANAKPDGHTLLLGSESPLIITRRLQSNIEYDLDSFTFLHAYGTGAVFFTVRPDSQWKTIQDFIDEAKKRPGELTYATHGIGSLSHFIAEVLWKEAGVKVTHVPYKSGPQANTAVLGGHVDIAVPPSYGALAAKGAIRVLATTANERVPFAPTVPTLKEQGFKAQLNYYSILLGPKGLPEDVRNKLVDAHEKAYAKYRKEIDEGLIRLELAPIKLSGQQARGLMNDSEAWTKAVAPELGLK